MTKKFEELKEKTVAENESRYGNEIREKYGNKTVDSAAGQKFPEICCL